jgi:hypothetical protein
MPAAYIPATIGYKAAEGNMNINKILAELRAEREDIDRAIIALQRMGGKKMGRPPKWMKALEKGTAGQKKKPSKDKRN